MIAFDVVGAITQLIGFTMRHVDTVDVGPRRTS